jgi:hypothetical protein
LKTKIPTLKLMSILFGSITLIITLVLVIFGFPRDVRSDSLMKNDQTTRVDKRAPDVLRPIITEGFEEGVMPPTGWTHIQNNTTSTWKISSSNTYAGTYSAQISGDPNTNAQDEILLSPSFNPTEGNVSFWSRGWLIFCPTTEVICDLEVYYVKGDWDGGTGDDFFLGSALDDWESALGWYASSFDFSVYADGNPARIGFRALGLEDENVSFSIMLDEIIINADIDHDVYLPLIMNNFHQADWTIMVYLDGDNDYESHAIDDFLDISSVGSSAEVNVLVQFDRIAGNDDRFGDWTDTLRYLVTSGMEPTEANALVDLDEKNMGAAETLIDFVEWGKMNYPATHFAVIVWDHGDGWPGDGDGPFYGLLSDETSSGDTLGMPEIRSALDTITNGGENDIDLFGFNASLMAMVEVDAQLIPYVDVRVGSEDDENPGSWPFATILTTLAGDSLMSPDTFATEIVNDIYVSLGNDGTHSAIELGTAYETLITEVDDFAAALMGGLSSYNSEIQTAISNTQVFTVTDYVDLYDFAYQAKEEVVDTTIDQAATAVMMAVNGVKIRERHGSSWPGAHGISIYFPDHLNNYNKTYDGSEGYLEFTADTQWDEWLNQYLLLNVCDSQVILNCSFESGQGVGWTESSTNGWDLIVDKTTLYDTYLTSPMVMPHSGEWAVWLGGDVDHPEVSIITQQVTVPDTNTTLTFWYQLQSDGSTCTASNSTASVEVNDTVVWSLDICIDNEENEWQMVLVDLSSYADQSVKLEFIGDTVKDPDDQYANQWFVDDVDFVP